VGAPESLTSPRMDRLVARIFQVLQGNYGSRFLNMWKTGQTLPDGNDAGIVNAMAEWGKKLAGVAEQSERIKRVLQTLPDDPPSLPKFLELCRQVRIDGDKQRLEHKQTPEEIERARQFARSLKRAIDNRDHFGWIKRPKNQAAFSMAVAEAKNNSELRAVIDQCIADGICNESGYLLKHWDGVQWVKCAA